jgi:hypothetical protein
MSLSDLQQQPTSGPLVAISVSFERDNLLARGLGLDHLKELLVRLTRPCCAGRQPGLWRPLG